MKHQTGSYVTTAKRFSICRWFKYWCGKKVKRESFEVRVCVFFFSPYILWIFEGGRWILNFIFNCGAPAPYAVCRFQSALIIFFLALLLRSIFSFYLKAIFEWDEKVNRDIISDLIILTVDLVFMSIWEDDRYCHGDILFTAPLAFTSNFMDVK